MEAMVVFGATVHMLVRQEIMEFVLLQPQAAATVTGTYTLDTSGRSGYYVYSFTGNGSITF